MTSRPMEASEVLGCLGRVYALEKEVRGQDPEVRRQHRLAHIQPLLLGLFERLAEMRPAALPSEPLRKAIDYASNQREALLRFLGNGQLEPDNNRAYAARGIGEVMPPPGLCRVTCLGATDRPGDPLGGRWRKSA